MNKIKYSDKLKDPRWQRRRLEIFKRDNFTCQSCNATEDTLVVHHFKYHNEPWDIDENYLVTLCESCHLVEHEYRKDLENKLLDIIKFKRFTCDQLMWFNVLLSPENISSDDFLALLMNFACDPKKTSEKTSKNISDLYERIDHNKGNEPVIDRLFSTHENDLKINNGK